MAYFETIGIQMLVKGASNFARDISHMAMGLSQFSGSFNKFNSDVQKASDAQVKYWQKSVQAAQSQTDRIVQQYNKVIDAVRRTESSLAENKTLAFNAQFMPDNSGVSIYSNATRAAQADATKLRDLKEKLMVTEEKLTASLDKESSAQLGYNNAVNTANGLTQEYTSSFGPLNGAFQMILGRLGLSSSKIIEFANSMGINIPMTKALVVGLDLLSLTINTLVTGATIVIGIFKALWNVFSFGVGVVYNIAKAVGQFALNIVSIPFKLVYSGFLAIWDSLKRIGEIAIGMNLSNLIWNLGQKFRELANEAFDAASNFQLVQIRLKGLIQRELSETGQGSFSGSAQIAADRAKELSYWISQLGVKSIFNASTIEDMVTLAMSYDMTEQQSKELTLATVKFATSMGLSDDNMRAVIENFGQMRAAGKITGTELRDLSRGAFVPINSILEIMGKNLGVTGKNAGDLKVKMQDMVANGAVPIDEFFKAFIQFTEKNFPNAIESAGTSMKVVLSNIQDFLQTIIGWRVITPILDVISKKMSGLLNQFLTDDFRSLAEDVGSGLAVLTDAIMTFIDGIFGTFDISKLTPKLLKFAEGIKAIFVAAKGGATGVDIANKIKGLKDISGILKDFGLDEKQVNTVSTLIENTVNAVANGKFDFESLKKLFKMAIGGIFSTVIAPAFKKGWEFITNNAPTWWNQYISPELTKLWNLFSGWISDLWTNQIPKWWTQYGSPAAAKLVQGISDWFTSSSGEFMKLGSTIVTEISKALSSEGQSGSQAVADIGKFFVSLFEIGVSTAIDTVFGALGTKVSTAVQNDKSFQGLPDTIAQNIDPLTKAVDNLSKVAKDAIDKSLNNLSKWATDSIPGWQTLGSAVNFVRSGLELIVLDMDLLKTSVGGDGGGSHGKVLGALIGDLGSIFKNSLALGIGIANQAILIFLSGMKEVGIIVSAFAKADALLVQGKIGDIPAVFSDMSKQILDNGADFNSATQAQWTDIIAKMLDTVQKGSDQMVGHSIWPDMLNQMSDVTSTVLNDIFVKFDMFRSAIIAVIASTNLYNYAFSMVMSLWQGLIDGLNNGPSGTGKTNWAAPKASTHNQNKYNAINAASGLNFIVPPGFPNDRFGLKLGLTSGERVIVVPNWKMPASNIMNSSVMSNRSNVYNSNNYQLGVNTMMPTETIANQFDVMRLAGSSA